MIKKEKLRKLKNEGPEEGTINLVHTVTTCITLHFAKGQKILSNKLMTLFNSRKLILP